MNLPVDVSIKSEITFLQEHMLKITEEWLFYNLHSIVTNQRSIRLSESEKSILCNYKLKLWKV